MESFILFFDYSHGSALLRFIALGFFGGIVLMVIAAKSGLMRRKNRLHFLLTKLYYLYVPLTCAFLLFAWSSINALHSEVHTAVVRRDSTIRDRSVEAAKRIRDEISAKQKENNLTTETLLETVREVTGETVFGYAEHMGAEARAIYRYLRDTSLDFFLESIKLKLAERAGNSAKVDARALLTLWNEGLTPALKDGLLTQLILGRLDAYAESARSGLVRLGTLLLLPVLLEMLFFTWRRKRRERDTVRRNALA